VELTIGASKSGKGLRLEINGDVDWTVKGNFHLNITGDSVFESGSHTHIAKTDMVTKAQNQTHMALARHTTEAPDIVKNQGLFISEATT
jgi:hypothetical protein